MPTWAEEELNQLGNLQANPESAWNFPYGMLAMIME